MARRGRLRSTALCTLWLLLAACAGRSREPAAPDLDAVLQAGGAEALQPFGGRAELDAWLAERAVPSREPTDDDAAAGVQFDAGGVSALVQSAQTSSRDFSAAITNNQEAGVDEGGIVKMHGDHLVVLRRGRLFTLAIHGRPRPIASIHVPRVPGHEAWYDEMLIHRDRVIVIGYSYAVSATEIAMFTIDDRGRITRDDTFFLASNDYYSVGNYASRLVGGKLVFYMPHFLSASEPERALPMLGHWGEGGFGGRDGWQEIVAANEIIRPIQPTDEPVLHTVVACDLAGELRCRARGIIGGWGRSFYVSRDAVYVWTHDGESSGATAPGASAPAVVYRLPLGEGRPGALRVWGAPIDQFSFDEDARGGLDVLVAADSPGDMMWAREAGSGDLAMFRVPIAAFDLGVRTVSAGAYVDLPEEGGRSPMRNRFVGDFVLYGRGPTWFDGGGRQEGTLFAHRVAADRDATEIGLAHGVERIEVLGRDAVVIGSRKDDLHFSAIALDGEPRTAGTFVERAAAQGETRSHGFFFRADAQDRGLLGLPVRKGGAAGVESLEHGSAAVLFLDVRARRFRELGELDSDPRAPVVDGCMTSCVDWYGNARPIFVGRRIFALLGYELVEGRIDRGRIREVARADMLAIPSR
jgi:hypothetical protein